MSVIDPAAAGKRMVRQLAQYATDALPLDGSTIILIVKAPNETQAALISNVTDEETQHILASLAQPENLTVAATIDLDRRQ